MSRITLRQLLDHAEYSYGVPAFNINNMEQVLAIMEAGREVDAMQALCKDRFEQFNTAGKASRITPICVADMARRYAGGSLDPQLTASQSAA